MRALGRDFKFGFPLAPMIFGVILGDQIEVTLVRALMTEQIRAVPCGPISGGMLVLAVVSVMLAVWQHRRQHGKRATAPAEEEVDSGWSRQWRSSAR